MFDVHATSAAAYSVNVDGEDFRFADVNQACLTLAGLTTRFHAGLTPHDCFPVQIADGIVARYRACRDSRQAVSYVAEIARADGTARRWRTTLFPVTDAMGRVTSMFGVLADAGEDRSDIVHLLTGDSLPLVMGTIDGGFWVYDVATGAFETSAPLAEFLAGPGRTTLGLAEYLNHIHAEDLGAGLIYYPDTDRTLHDYRVITFEGRTRWLQSRRRVIRDGAGHAVKVVSLVVDITEQKERLRTLETEATVDPLTSLKNRRSFERNAIQALREARAGKERIAILLIDLDGFKPVNDRLGHRAGDEILRKVARRLTRHVRKSDTLARIGGDEFAVVIHPASGEDAAAAAARIMRAFYKPFTLAGKAVPIGLSVGVAVSTLDDTSVSTLIERADRDLYAIKLGRRASA